MNYEVESNGSVDVCDIKHNESYVTPNVEASLCCGPCHTPKLLRLLLSRLNKKVKIT